MIFLNAKRIISSPPVMKNIHIFHFALFFLFFFFLIISENLSAKDVVLLNKTTSGVGATEEQARKVFDALVNAMKQAENVEVRTDSGCEEPCEAPVYIISSELRVEDQFITLYFRIINRKKGLAANIQRMRLKDAKFQDMIDMLTAEYIKTFFDFIDRGSYSGTKVIEK